MNPTVAVEATDVRKCFGPTQALASLSRSIHEGETYGLLGPNGSGTTRFIRCLAGLLRPDSGRVAVLGMSPRVAVSAARVGYMTQASLRIVDLLDGVLGGHHSLAECAQARTTSSALLAFAEGAA